VPPARLLRCNGKSKAPDVGAWGPDLLRNHLPVFILEIIMPFAATACKNQRFDGRWLAATGESTWIIPHENPDFVSCLTHDTK
jgi:hypothetical protein